MNDAIILPTDAWVTPSVDWLTVALHSLKISILGTNNPRVGSQQIEMTQTHIQECTLFNHICYILQNKIVQNLF